MELMTREEIKTKYHIPLGSVDARMKELGVEPHLPPKKGRGWAILYDGIEIETALRNEREKRVAQKEGRSPSPRLKPKNPVHKMTYKQFLAQSRLTNGVPAQ